ncbi:ABC-F family ATP-binding cassette domain-containing protein [Cyanobacterium stanieri LEGE 03274]|uniref:ABC-F family ATP-binding cassette domain-containing protein n=1 Tax=Cyanobacterium stanieri LEGE 03274 TaxID=1828756 RepID=A0ABR9V1Y8_9CHRO|nr:ABC-F family ATP-binding cassette domain-containing protein [Cyanobacterium stanieri]MBE9221905.1 ABC-F family ATP-binding cassette domain-containing protein [Cyanobacterium stanieri LEGE 03274]
MTILTVQSLKKDFGIKEIIKDASFSIEDNDKVGLIGVNGAGKSTLLKMLASIEPTDGGEMVTKSGARIIYLPQQPDIDPDHTVLEQVFADCGEQMQWIREYEDLSHRIAHADTATQEQLMGQLARVTEKIDSHNAWNLEAEAKIILDKLGIQDFEAKMGSLSGGYRKRVALASVLMAEPDLLLMDEPTNHLDAESVEWLQEYLKQFSGAIFLITHDRYFLDQVTTRILEVDRGEVFSYAGNYSYYLEKKALAEESEASSERKHQGVLRRELEWLKRGPKARSTKQKARIDRISDMKNKQFRKAQGKVEIDTPSRRIGKKVIELHGIGKSYGDRTLINDFTYIFEPDDRVGIIGGNGVGKSTLMNMIMGKVEPDDGYVDIGGTIKIGYFDQHSDDLITAKEQQLRAIEYIKEVATYIETSDGGQISASQLLERFLFTPNQQYAPIEKLSGGEKRRLFLLRMLISNPNVLILDEPTNDLDVQTLAVLEEYIETFKGCVIVVSHDRYFLDRTVETIFAFQQDGTLKQYPGNYSIYLEYKRRQEAREKEELEQVKAVEKNKKKQQHSNKKEIKNQKSNKKLSNFELRELDKLENKTIPNLEEKKANIENKLYQNQGIDYEELQNLTQELANINKELDNATEKWMELAEMVD